MVSYKKNKILSLLYVFFRNDYKFSIYKKNIFSVFKFSKKNFNIVTYDQLFFKFKKIDLNDLKIIIYILKKIGIKILEKMPFKYIISKNENKNSQNNKTFLKKISYSKEYNYLNDFKIKKSYNKINLYLNNISRYLLSNIFIVNSIFRSNNKNKKKFINKINFLNSNLSSKNFFLLKYKNFLKKRFFINKKNKKNININNNLYSDLYYELNKNFSLLNFLIDNILKYRLKNKEKKCKLLLNHFKTRKFKFKVNLQILDPLYKKLIKKFNIIDNIRIEVYDSLCNLSNISFLEFNFFFLKYGSDLKWILNIINKNINYFPKKKYIKFINKKSLEIKNIETKYFTKIKNLFKIYSFIEINKLKIDIIRNNIINSKKNIISKITKKYYKSDLYNDFFQEGNLSLIRSFNKYDFKANLNFDSFIIYSAKKAINKYIYGNNKLIKLPSYMLVLIKKINNIIKDYNNLYNTDPTTEYIADNLNIDKRKIENIFNLCKPPSSMNKVYNDNSFEITEFLKNNNYYNFDDEIFNNDLKNYIEDIMKKLNNRSSNILNMRYGLNFSRRYTLEEVGSIYNLSRERIRQIQNFVLKKIKDFPDEIKRLENFFKYKYKYYYFKK